MAHQDMHYTNHVSDSFAYSHICRIIPLDAVLVPLYTTGLVRISKYMRKDIYVDDHKREVKREP